MLRNINQDLFLPGYGSRTYMGGVCGTERTVPITDLKSEYRGYEHITGNTPDYWAKKKSGLFVPPHYLWWARSRHLYPSGSSFYETLQGSVWCRITRQGSYSDYLSCEDYLLDSAELDSLRRRVDANLLQKAKAQHIDLAVAFAEGKEVVDLFASTAKRVAKSYSLLRKGNFSGFASYLGLRPRGGIRSFRKEWNKDPTKAAADAWLEYTYAWRPLVQDVYGAVDHLRKRGQTRRSVRTSASASQSDTIKVTNSDGVKCNHTRNTTLLIKGGMTVEITDAVLAEANQLGMTNPATIAWELLPYSFVVDWFLPVGSWLSNIGATAGLQFLGGYTVEVWEQTVTSTFSGGTKTATTRYDVSAAGSRERKRVNLTARTSWPANHLPELKNPFSTSHVASSMALMRNAFGR